MEPTASAADRRNALRQSLPAEHLVSLLQTLGPLDHSIEKFSHRLYSIDPDATVAGVVSVGGFVLRTLTPEQTLTVQNYSKVSTQAMIAINRAVRAFQLGKISIFAPQPAVNLLLKDFKSILKFDVFSHKLPNSERIGDYTQINVPYSYGSPFDAMKSHLSALRVSPKMKSNPVLGIDLGAVDGLAIPVIIMGDAGGGVMSFIAEFQCFEGANQQYNMSLGEFKGKESYFLLENTIIPHINAGVNDLNKHYALILEWPTGFDFVIIPSSVCLFPVRQNTLPELDHLIKNRDPSSTNTRACWRDSTLSISSTSP